MTALRDERSIIVGRGPGADLTISDDPYVSPMHARIVERPIGSGRDWSGRALSTFFVEDLGSTNGTKIFGPGGLVLPALGLMHIPPGWGVQVGHTRLPWRA